MFFCHFLQTGNGERNSTTSYSGNDLPVFRTAHDEFVIQGKKHFKSIFDKVESTKTQILLGIIVLYKCKILMVLFSIVRANNVLLKKHLLNDEVLNRPERSSKS